MCPAAPCPVDAARGRPSPPRKPAMFPIRSHGWMALVAVLLGPWLASAAEPALPAHLPRYRLSADIDVENHVVHGRLEATWTNPNSTPTNRLVFNAHARHVVPPSDVALVAKTLELLRMQPSDAMGLTEPPREIHKSTLAQPSGPALAPRGGAHPPPPPPLTFSYEGMTKTDLVVPLPHEVRQNQSVTVVIDFTLTLPQKQ